MRDPDLSPKSRLYIADLLRAEAERLKTRARSVEYFNPELWGRSKDLERLAVELEEM